MVSADLQSLADAAIAAFRAGALDEAERGFREILARDPDNARMRSNLGVLLTQTQRADEAIPLLAAASAAEPANPTTFRAYANALIATGRFEAAEAMIGGRADLGDAARQAELALRRAWAHRHLLGSEAVAAEAHLLRAYELAPDNAEVLAELGRVRLALGRPQDATADLGRALELAPESLVARLNLAAACRSLGRLEEAEAHYRRALDIAPHNAHALRNLRILLVEQRRHAEALEAATTALAAGAQAGEIHLSQGVALAGLGRDAEAVAALEIALSKGADRFEAQTALGLSQSTLGNYQAALAAFDAAVAERPDDPGALTRRASVRLRLCDFEGGWRDYEARWRNPVFLAAAGSWAPQALDRIEVDPEPDAVAGRRVLAAAEQGIGDQVMFASMVPDLMRDAREVTLLVDRRLRGLFAHSFPGACVLGFGEVEVASDDYDTAVGLGSLGRLYRNRPADFPGTAYLRPGAAARETWRARLGPRTARLRVGLSWRGGTAETRANERSLSLPQLSPLLDLEGCEFVSLQYGDVAEEVAAANGALAVPIRLFGPDEIDDFEDLAALALELDLVVSVQTALVHLCGAVGAACHVMVPRHAEWRYTAASPTMPWYGSVRLHRQAKSGDWGPVIAEVADVLRGRPASGT